MTYLTITKADELAEMTGINVSNLYSLSRGNLEELIMEAGQGVDTAEFDYEVEAYREVEQLALAAWEYRFGA